MSEYDFIDHDYDVIVVGAGGSGLRATFGLSQSGLKTDALQRFFLLEATQLLLKEG